MSQYTPHDAAPSPMPYPEQQDQLGYGQGPAGSAPVARKTNTMAILGLIFAFVMSPLGIVFSAIGLSQIKKRHEGGRGLAIAGLILSILFTLLAVLAVVFVFAAVQQAAETDAMAEEEIGIPAEAPADDQGVLAACEVIAPALGQFDAAVANVATPEEYAQLVTEVRASLEGAAATTSDPMFAADVQMMSDNLQLTADAVNNGEDPSYLDAALTEDDARVAEACAAAGY